MKFLAKAALAAVVLAVSPVTAQAATVMINSTVFDPGSRPGTVHVVSNSYNRNTNIGRFQLTGTDTMSGDPVSFLTYCVDLFHTLGAGVFTTQSLATYVADPVRRANLANFITNADALVGSNVTNSAAAQMGVWEILYENGTGYDVNSGNFWVNNGNAGSVAARALANTWLNNVTSGAWTQVAGRNVTVLYNAQNQSQVFVGRVPEPAAWGMMLMGFGFIGAALRRSRVRKSGTHVLA